MFLCHWNKAPHFVFNFTMYIIEKKKLYWTQCAVFDFNYHFSRCIYFNHHLLSQFFDISRNASYTLTTINHDFKPDIYPFGIFKYFLYNNIICFPSRKVTFQSVIVSSVITGLWVILLRPLHFRSMQTASIIALLWLKSSPLLSLNKR